MEFVIEPVMDKSAEAAAAYVREEVFGREWNLQAPRLDGCQRTLTLVARTEWDANPAAALTVVDTTGDDELHTSLGLRFKKGERVARYAQLAVLKPYRGMNLPVRLLLEARRLFVGPERFAYTWLLFDAGRAQSSSLCTVLGFHASRRTFRTECGHSRVLLRNENEPAAELNDWKAGLCLDPAAGNSYWRTAAPPPFQIARLQPNEWIAQ